MSTRKLALGLVAITAACGCDGAGGGPTVEFEERDFVCDGEEPPCLTTAEAHSPADRTHVAPEGDPETYTFVVATISLPEVEDGLAAGFNLDGLNSGGGSSQPDADCEEFNEDFDSLTDRDHVGVDNALQGLIGTIEGFLEADMCPGGVTAGCLDSLLQEQVNEGSVILMMEITGVNDLEYDSDIELQLFLGMLPEGTMPQLDDEDHIAPGQSFMTAMELGDPVEGDIFDGRVRASAPSLTLLISTSDFDIPLVITNPEVRFDLDDGLATNGAIGGYIQNADIIAAASEIAPGMEDLVEQVITNLADIDPVSDVDDPETEGFEPAMCQALSVGITFGAVNATRE